MILFAGLVALSHFYTASSCAFASLPAQPRAIAAESYEAMRPRRLPVDYHIAQGVPGKVQRDEVTRANFSDGCYIDAVL